MKLTDIVFMAVDGIRERKFRVALNILGILVGISAIVALLSLTNGMSVSITHELEILDPQTIIVTPGSFMGMTGQGAREATTGTTTLTLRDIDRIKRISGVALVTPVISKTVKIHISGYSDSVTVTGIIPEEYPQAFATVEVTEGRFLRGSDGMSTVLGAKVAHPQHLDEPIASLGSRITLDITGQEEKETVSLRVTGILEEVGGTMFTSVDTWIFVTFTTAQRIFHTGNIVDQIIIKAESVESVDRITEEVQDELGENVMVMSSESITAMVGTVMTMMEAILGGIAAISLVVAGIAVINTMTISVMERTREIGVMKALGAKSRDILTMFLTESLLTGLIGGVIGVVFGVLLGQIASIILTFTMNVSLSSVFSLEVGVIGIVFAATTGTLSGFYPSRKASKLAPVEALRYE